MKISGYERRANEITARCSGHFYKYSEWVAAMELLNKAFDEERQAVADAALDLFLYSPTGTGITEIWLMVSEADKILACQEMVNKYRAEAVIINPLFVAYPNRERTADAAEFLWKTQIQGDWVETLQGMNPLTIRTSAEARQINVVGKVADAAWIAFNEGPFSAQALIDAAPEYIVNHLAPFSKGVKKKHAALVQVSRLYGASITEGGRVNIRFYSGSTLVGETTIEGLYRGGFAPYMRRVEIGEPFTCYRIEASIGAIVQVSNE